jgi:hypothetical protein
MQNFYDAITSIDPWEHMSIPGGATGVGREMTEREKWEWRIEHNMMREDDCEYVELEDKWEAFRRIFGRKHKFKPHPLDNTIEL